MTRPSKQQVPRGARQNRDNNARSNHSKLLQEKRAFIASVKRDRPNQKIVLPAHLRGLPRVNVKPETQRPRQSIPAKSIGTVAVATQPLQTSTDWDYYGFINLVECIAADYAMRTDLFEEITPQLFAYYLTYCTLMHIHRFGGLSFPGTNSFVPPSSDKVNFTIPRALGDYLEYLSPYNTPRVNLTVNYTLNNAGQLFATSPASTGIGYDAPWSARPPWMPLWEFFPIQTGTEADGINIHHIVFYRDTGGPGTKQVQFSEFVTDTYLINATGQAIQKRPNSMKLRDVASKAPDSSAYARLLIPLGLENETVGGFRGVDKNYDPEVTFLINPTASGGNSYTPSFQKSFVPPKIVAAASLFTSPVTQLASVWVFLAQTDKRPYRPGRFRQKHPFCGVVLQTLYPTEQPVSGYSLSQHVQLTHNQLVANKAAGGTAFTDTNNRDLVTQAMVAFSAQQRRMNDVEVCHWNCPPCWTVGDDNITLPQLFYADASFATQNLPIAQAACISAIGPIVVDRVLRIPISPYDGKFTHADGQIIGPYVWSAYGLVSNYDSYFGGMNTFSSCWSQYNGATPTPPTILIDNVLNVNADAAFVVDNYGCQPGFNDLTFLCPAIPTGGNASVLLSSYNTIFQGSMYGQTPALVQVSDREYGDFSVMSMSYVTNKAGSALISTQPLGGTAASDCVGVLNLPSGVAYPFPRQTTHVAFSALNAQGPLASLSDNSTQVRESFLKFKAYLAKVPGAVDTSLTTDLIGSHTVDLPWSAGSGGLLSNVARLLANPTSPESRSIVSAVSRGADVYNAARDALSPLLRRSMRGANLSNVPASSYVGGVKDAAKVHGFKKILNDTTGVVKKGFHYADKGIKIGTKIVSTGADVLKWGKDMVDTVEAAL